MLLFLRNEISFSSWFNLLIHAVYAERKLIAKIIFSVRFKRKNFFSNNDINYSFIKFSRRPSLTCSVNGSISTGCPASTTPSDFFRILPEGIFYLRSWSEKFGRRGDSQSRPMTNFALSISHWVIPATRADGGTKEFSLSRRRNATEEERRGRMRRLSAGRY